jgi:hypothetical protein
MFVWLEDGKLKVAFQKELAPDNAIEIDTFGLNPIPPIEVFVEIEDGQIVKKSQDEVLQWFKDQKLAELKNYVASLLGQTDYIIVKISEAQISGDTDEVERLKQKYATQLQQREAIRQWNEQMKQAIRNAQTLEELRSIEIRYG